MTGSARIAQAVRRLESNHALQVEMPEPLTSGRDLSGDHPTFELARGARVAASAALDAGETHYADVPGIAPLREAVAGELAAMGLRADAESGLIITSGEQEGRFLAIHTLSYLGYRIVLPSIVHPGTRRAASLGGVTVDRLELDPLTMTPALVDLARASAAGRVALYLESPNRLTGKVIDPEHVAAIADRVLQTNAVVIWDATLAPWVDGAPPTLIGALPGMADRAITLGTLWSGAGVEDWLAAYLAGPPGLFQRAQSLKQIVAICTTTPAQWGVLGILQTGRAAMGPHRMTLQRIKAEAAAVFPSGVMTGEAASVLAVRPAAAIDPSRLPASALPAVPMPGEAFGAPGVLRFTVTPTGDIVGAMRALAARDAAAKNDAAKDAGRGGRS